jgi:hypothetical protein
MLKRPDEAYPTRLKRPQICQRRLIMRLYPIDSVIGLALLAGMLMGCQAATVA